MRSVKAPFPLRVTYEFEDAPGGGSLARIRTGGETGRYYALAGRCCPRWSSAVSRATCARSNKLSNSVSGMDSTALRELQAPLKQRYRDDPDAAVVTLKASGSLGEGITCSVDTGRALAEAGLHPASGGDGTQLCSGDMLLEALAACAGVTLRAVATSLGIEVAGGRVHAEGDLDFRGTLGVDRDAPVGFRSIRLRFDLETDAGEEDLATLVRLTERYCVVLQTLARPPELSVGIAGSAGRVEPPAEEADERQAPGEIDERLDVGRRDRHDPFPHRPRRHRERGAPGRADGR